ncbi:ankyrin repeat-containing protein [Grosmannia clavigera kw1407]|uniref:Ankyrin repeat-containing protein n=1 Tax=Grosmannia clavigera (strain kw1407 / UAMH 11150) TaxID=655863 RepID=F0XLB2_GROCL|nr:ankyrin repeat-containing protein [Grosmannia clavigera kw1407]EFX01243.1 ankyrin repeat-containing protein [Grosmannia clavigera kw1407]
MVSKKMTVQGSGIIDSMSSDLDKQMVRLKSPPFEEPIRSDSIRTFRVRGVPKDWTEDNLEARLTATYGEELPTVESLAVEYDGQWQTATVSFPSTFPTGESRIKIEGSRRNRGTSLTVDDGFIGITTLHKPAPEDHKYDLIAVPGLGAHAFGSFKERGGDHMWLRDALPAYMAGTGKSNTRVMTYGYEASLSDSRNFQGLSDIGIAFMHSVFDATQGPNSAGSDSRPIIFVAHSLGGLVVKQALIALQESKEPEHMRLLRAVRGIAFFGVPNDGMNIGSLKAMVGDRPNRQLLESIGSDADFLRRQYQDFQKFLQMYDPVIISFYETNESPTAQMAAAPSARPTDLVLSFFFHGRGHDLQRTSLGLIRYLLHQVLEQLPTVLQGLVDMSKQKSSQFKENKWHWNENELWPFFESAIPEILEKRSVWLFTDALDECGEDSATVVIERFLSLITKLSARASDHHRFRICFACRPYPVQDWKNGLEIHPEDNNKADISTFVMTQLSHVDPAISELVIRQASGVFLWVDLVVRKVRKLTKKGTSPAKIQAAIAAIPQDLYSLYADLIQQMNAASLRMFQWVLFATRPLSLNELRWAMEIRPDRPSSSNAYTMDNEQMSRQVQTLSCGLLEVTATPEGHVQFIHQSVKDFFNKKLTDLDSRFPPRNSLPSSTLAIGRAYYQLSRACIRYLKREELQNTRLSPYTMFSRYPFLKYALTSWLTHTLQSAKYGVPMKDILGLFDWPSNSFVAFLAHIEQILRLMPENYRLNHISKGSSLVHIAARFGIQELLSDIIKSSHDHIDDRDEDGMTPLSFAAEKGHKAVVQLLLATKNVKVDSKDTLGKTPLSRAAGSGHDDVVALLLATNTVDVNSTDLYYGQTPLCWAAKQGHKAVVRLLLATKKVIADSRDENGRTPLSLAAENGHEAVVELLVAANNVDVNSKAVHGQTPLSRAAENGHEAVVRLLLATKNVNVDSKDSVYGQTPLSCAAEKGHEAVVRLLLATNGVNADSRDEFGRTPLSWAAENGHEAVVKLLVATNGVNVNSTDVYDNTLVHRAAEQGHKAIAELLQMEIQRRGN